MPPKQATTKTVSEQSQVIIKSCTCKHKYQDETYGAGKRVHNFVVSSKGGKRSPYRCTVCCKERD